MKTIGVLCVAAGVVALGAYFCGCSRDDRGEVVERLDNAAQALKGCPEGGEKTPRIVKEQQKKERVRQDMQWTPDNQALYPMEYCQAQLVEMERYSRLIDVQMYRLAASKSSLSRRIEDQKGELVNIERFLKDAKAAYHVADSANAWPVTINGFQLSKEKAKEKIVEAANRIAQLKRGIVTAQGDLMRVENKMSDTLDLRKRVDSTRNRIVDTIGDLKSKKILDGEQGVTDALNAINDSIYALQVNEEEPSIDELVAPSRQGERERIFSAIMSNE